jgi:3-methyladenine DNA glycosylase AlkD
MKHTHLDVIRTLEKHKNKQKAAVYQRFFKTGKGGYGEGDQFFGITVPQQRVIAKEFFDLSLSEVDKLIRHPIHECRLTAFIIVVEQYKKGDKTDQEKLYRWYLRHAKRINNWDLVDSSASYIIGAHLFVQKKSEWKKVLVPLAQSDNLWERRISIISTHYFIRQGDFEPTIKIATQLLSDKHDLMHKACGWMLREVGKKDIQVLRVFLDIHAHVMPRTMLRYAIERMSQGERKKYMVQYM